jgi:uncharacterized membrane protein YgcG
MANPTKPTEGPAKTTEGLAANALKAYKEQQLPECVPTVEDLAKVFEAQDKATLEVKFATLEARDPHFLAYILSKAGTGESKRKK